MAALSENTKRNYKRILTHLNGGVATDSLGFLNDTAAVMSRLRKPEKGNKPVSDNTCKSRLTAVMSAMSRAGMTGTAYDVYKSEFDRVKGELVKHLKSGELTEKQEQNWLEADDLQDLWQALKERAEADNSTFRDRQDYMLLSLYFKAPPQRNLEYFLMRIIIGKTPAVLDSRFNYLLFDEKRMVIHQHKNTAVKGTKFIDISKCDELLDALIVYVAGLGAAPRGAKMRQLILLRHENGTAWERSDMIREALNRITGKRVGAQMMRTIQATHKAPANKEALANVIQEAHDMGHSFEEHLLTYVKNR